MIPVTLAEVMRTALESDRGEVHTCLPGRVEKYDVATQTADIRPMVKRAVADGDEVTYESLPVIPEVPVSFPRGGGFFISFPIAVGDSVLLVFSEASIAEWRTTGQESEPADLRKHSWYPFAIPCIAPDADALDDASATKLVIGKDGAVSQILVDGSSVQIGKGSGVAAAMGPALDAMHTAVKTFSAAVKLGVAATDPGSTVTLVNLIRTAAIVLDTSLAAITELQATIAKVV